MAMMSKYFAFLIFNVFFVFTLAAAFWDLISNFVKNPLAFLEQLPTTLPAGAVINYYSDHSHTFYSHSLSITLYQILSCIQSSYVDHPRQF